MDGDHQRKSTDLYSFEVPQLEGKTAYDREYNPHRWSHYTTMGGAMVILFVLIWAMGKISL
jgi:hypothetical protein